MVNTNKKEKLQKSKGSSPNLVEISENDFNIIEEHIILEKKELKM